jgi:hypothetical protein
MDNQDAIRRRLIARSRRYVDTLMDLADRVVTREDLPYDPDDPASFMIRGFASKQHDHLHSVRILVDAGQDGDATIIARTMLEGVAQLVWALRGQPGRPALWWWYAAIMDWRQLKKNEQEGLAISPEQWQGIDQLLGQHGRQYYTREAQTKVKKGRTVPADPYRWWWHDVSIREIFEEVGGKEHYKELYGIASERIHWNPRSMLRSLDIVEGMGHDLPPALWERFYQRIEQAVRRGEEHGHEGSTG